MNFWKNQKETQKRKTQKKEGPPTPKQGHEVLCFCDWIVCPVGRKTVAKWSIRKIWWSRSICWWRFRKIARRCAEKKFSKSKRCKADVRRKSVKVNCCKIANELEAKNAPRCGKKHLWSGGGNCERNSWSGKCRKNMLDQLIVWWTAWICNLLVIAMDTESVCKKMCNCFTKLEIEQPITRPPRETQEQSNNYSRQLTNCSNLVLNNSSIVSLSLWCLSHCGALTKGWIVWTKQRLTLKSFHKRKFTNSPISFNFMKPEGLNFPPQLLNFLDNGAGAWLGPIRQAAGQSIGAYY